MDWLWAGRSTAELDWKVGNPRTVKTPTIASNTPTVARTPPRGDTTVMRSGSTVGRTFPRTTSSGMMSTMTANPAITPKATMSPMSASPGRPLKSNARNTVAVVQAPPKMGGSALRRSCAALRCG